MVGVSPGRENGPASPKARPGPVLAAAGLAGPAARSSTGPFGDVTPDRPDDVRAGRPAGSPADAGIARPQPPGCGSAPRRDTRSCRGVARLSGGVPVVDDAGFPGKGSRSIGGAGRYPGTAGRVERCRVGVSPGPPGRHGRPPAGRQLHLPNLMPMTTPGMRIPALPMMRVCHQAGDCPPDDCPEP